MQIGTVVRRTPVLRCDTECGCVLRFAQPTRVPGWWR